MPAIALRDGHSAKQFREEAAKTRNGPQARRCLALAAVRDGESRAEAAKRGGMDRQTLRDWVHAYNERGIEGLIDGASPGRPCKLSPDHRIELKEIVERGPDFERDGVIRWRRSDLKRIVKTKFGVDVDEDTIGRALRELGFSHISPRPQHPNQDVQAIETFKKSSKPNSKRPSSI